MGMLRPLSIVLIVTGLVVIVLGVVLGWVVVPNIIDNKIEEETQLKNGTDIYDKWVEIPVPIYIKFYFFNVTNYQDFQGLDDWSKKIELKEVGPYVYKERRLKYEISSDTDNDTVTFKQNITYTFVPEMSAGPETDQINTINVPLISVATVFATIPADKFPPVWLRNFLLSLLSSDLGRERFVKTDVLVRDIVFGWRLNWIYDIVEIIAKQSGISFPPEFQNGRFGYYLDRNNTNADGKWEVFSGIKDSSKFNVIKNINDKNHLKEWWKNECAMINGTDGTMFPPFIKKDTIPYVHAPEICRSTWVEFKKTIEFKGISGYRFGLPDNFFDTPDTNPRNECFAPDVPDPLIKTNFKGIGRIFTCKSGAPIWLSKPHFLGLENETYLNFDGMKPDINKHELFVDIEPTTGFPLRGAKRIQIGLEIQSLLDFFGPWKNIPHTFVPALWVEEEVELDDALVNEIKSKLINPLKIVKIGKWSVVGVGSFITIIGIIYFSYLTWKKH